MCLYCEKKNMPTYAYIDTYKRSTIAWKSNSWNFERNMMKLCYVALS